MDVYVYGAFCDPGTEHDAAWKLLDRAVAEVFGESVLPAVTRESRGKPYFPDRPDICFNLSHSRGAVVCAVHDRAVGVDIEKMRSAPKRLAAGLDDHAFFLRWTAKEASIKRDGKGIDALRRDFEPDHLCRSSEELLPGWIVAVCPSEPAEIRFLRDEG